MNRLSRTLALAAVAAGLIVARQARPAAQTASLKNDFVKEWTGQKDTLVKMAEALLAREVLDADQVRKLAAGLPLDDPQPVMARTAVEEDEPRARPKERTPMVPSLNKPLPQE